MRRRWLLTNPNAAKKDFNEIVFPLNDADDRSQQESSMTYNVSASTTTVELPADLPAALCDAIDSVTRPPDGQKSDKSKPSVFELCTKLSLARQLQFGIALQYCSVWWIAPDRHSIFFWCWNNSPTDVHRVALSPYSNIDGALMAGPRLESRLIYMIPEIAEADAHFRRLDARRGSKESAPTPQRQVDGSIPATPGGASSGEDSAAYQDYTLLVLVGDRIKEVALRGSEAEGVVDSEPRSCSVGSIKSVSAAYHHAASGYSFFADTGGTIYEYRSYTLSEVYIATDPSVKKDAEETEGSYSKRLRSAFSSTTKNTVSSQPSLTQLVRSTWIPKWMTSKKSVDFTYFCEGANDVLFLGSANFEIYSLTLQPPLVQLASEDMLRYSERPTLMHERAVLTWETFWRSLSDCLELPGKVPSPKKADEGGRRPDSLCVASMSPAGGGGVELLLSDGTRVTCSTALAQRTVRWSGRSDELGKSLHESLRLRSDTYVWSHYQLASHSGGPLNVLEPQALMVTHVRWPPEIVCEQSVLHSQVHQRKPLLEAPKNASGESYCVVTAASSGVNHSSATTSGCWLAYRISKAGDRVGSLVVLNGRNWEQVTSGTQLLVCVRSEVPTRYRKLLGSNRTHLLWDSFRRIELAAVASQLPKFKSLPSVIAAMSSSFGIEGMPQLSVLRSETLGGLIGLTSERLVGCRQNSYADSLRNYLPSLQSLIDSIFKDLNFSLPFMPHGGLQVQDPQQLVAALERCATLPLTGLAAWLQFASRSSLGLSHADLPSNLGKSIEPADAAWLFYSGETHRTIDMCWHFLAVQAGLSTECRRGSSFSETPQHGVPHTTALGETDRAVDTCCRLLFSLTSIHRLREGPSVGASGTAGESESLISFRRFILQLLADFSHRPLFEIVGAARGVLASKPTDELDPHDSSARLKGASQSPKLSQRPSKKRTRRERDTAVLTSELNLITCLSAEDYRHGRDCCNSLLRAIQVYDAFVKSQISLDVRNKVQEDATQFAEVTELLETIGQIFEFMILVADAMEERLPATAPNAAVLDALAADAAARHKVFVSSEILNSLAQLSFAALAGNTVLERDNSLLQRWFEEGSLTRLVSPNALVKVCGELFDRPTMEWAAAIEPMKQLAEDFDAAHYDRRRQQAERVAALSATAPGLYSNLPGGGGLPTEVGALEYLFRLWEGEADSESVKDLDIALPLPSFIREAHGGVSLGGSSSEVFNLAVGDGLRGQARAHAIRALQTFVMVGRDKGELHKDSMFRQFLEILFRVHTFDFFHLTIATWADVKSRYHIWSRVGEISSNAQSELSPVIAEALHSYLDRLADVVVRTERIMGWDLLIALIRQLTCCEIPIFWTEMDLDSFSSSLQPYEMPIAHSVFKWMVDSERPLLPLTSLLESLKSPHIGSWLELQNQRNDALAAHKLSTAVSEVYLSQKNYGQALNQLLTSLDAQPSWLELPIRVNMLSETRLPPDAGKFALRANGATLSCIRELIDPAIEADMRAAFRQKLFGRYQDSEEWRSALELVQLIREAGSFPIDQRLDVLLKCLVLSVISDSGSQLSSTKLDAVETVAKLPPPPAPTQTSLLSSRIRGMLSQSQPTNLIDQLNKSIGHSSSSAYSQLSTNPIMSNLPTEHTRVSSGMLTARRLESAQRQRWNESRRLSPRSSQMMPSGPHSQNGSSALSSAANTSPMLHAFGGGSFPPSQNLIATNDTKSSTVVMLSEEDAEKMKALGASRGMVLDKMAETLALPGYVSKTTTGVGLRRSETDRLRHAQTKLLSQWSMIQDMTEYLSYLVIDAELGQRVADLRSLLKDHRRSEEDFFRPAHSRDELLRNAVGLIAKLVHAHFDTPYALIDCMLKLAVANAKVAPMNLISVVECWAQLDERRLRLTDAYRLLPETLSYVDGDVALSMVVANSTIGERLVLSKRHTNYSLITDMLLRFWNVFSLSLIDSALGDRQTERRILLEGNAASPLRLLPGILWRFMSARMLDCYDSFGEQDLQSKFALTADLKLLCERKTRLNLFLDIWEDGLLGEHESHVFVYEACVRVFIWDVVGLTRRASTAESYDTIEDLVRMSISNPHRVIAVLKPATHWLYAIGMTLLGELSQDQQGRSASAEFATLSRALFQFFGCSFDRLLVESVFSNVVKDMVDLITWLAHISLPGLPDFYSALAGTQHAPDLRYLAPLVKQTINEFKTQAANERSTHNAPSERDELDLLFGRAYYENGIDEVVPLLEGAENHPKWLLEAKPLVPKFGAPMRTTGIVELLDALLDCAAAASVLAAHDQSTGAIASLITVLRNYKLCVQSGPNYSATGSV